MTDKNVDISLLLGLLKKIPLFATLEEASHREIIAQITLMYYPAGYEIFNEGDAGDAMYILKKGLVEVFHPAKEEGDLPKKIANIGVGGFFGEMALVSEVPRNASVKTIEESEVFILSKDSFKKLLDTNPHLAEQVSAAIVSRLNENAKNQ